MCTIDLDCFNLNESDGTMTDKTVFQNDCTFMSIEDNEFKMCSQLHMDDYLRATKSTLTPKDPPHRVSPATTLSPNESLQNIRFKINLLDINDEFENQIMDHC